jgi:hypothetical protein
MLNTRKYSPELPEVFTEKMAEYFTEDNMPWLVTGLCNHLHICQDTLGEYSKIPQFSEPIKMAKQLIEHYSARQLFRDGNVTGIIFNLKHNFKWKDQQDIELSGKVDMPTIIITK